jgi:AraC-like DNA-binding protein
MSANSLCFLGLGDLYSRPPNWKVQSGYLRGFGRLVRNSGGDPRLLLERHHIDPVTLDDPDHYLDCSSVANLLEDCRERLCDPLFGLRLASVQSPDVFGCVTALARAAPTLRQGLQSFIGYLPVVHCPQSSNMEIVVARNAAEIRWQSHADLGDNQQAVSHGVLLIMKVLAMLAGQAQLSYANLTLPIERTALDAAQDIIGCRVHGKSAVEAIGFPAELLDRPIESSNRLLFKLLGSYLEQVRSTKKFTLVEQIENYVRDLPPSEKCTVGRCAEKLGISARTLQKRLTRMEMKFSDIVDNQRIKLAEQALRQSSCTLDEIASYLGYSEQSSFGRAFKRWTGTTPQSFREKQQAAKPH